MTKIVSCRQLMRLAALLAVAGPAAAGLEGCVSLLPKTPPVQLYQFGRTPALAPATTPAGAAVAVALSGVSLPRAALGDQLLTVTGDETAYLAGARWITPAVVMFQEDVERAFGAQGGPVQLVGQGNFATASALLGLDVGDFEVRYESPGAAPVILVSVRATLSRPDGQTLAVQTFSVREPAADNRIAPIVEAFDRATSRALGQVVAWTDANAPAALVTSQTVTTTTAPSQR